MIAIAVQAGLVSQKSARILLSSPLGLAAGEFDIAAQAHSDEEACEKNHLVTGDVLEPTGIGLQFRHVDLESMGRALQTQGIVWESAGAVFKPTGFVLKPQASF